MHPTYPTRCAYVELKKWTSVSPRPQTAAAAAAAGAAPNPWLPARIQAASPYASQQQMPAPQSQHPPPHPASSVPIISPPVGAGGRAAPAGVHSVPLHYAAAATAAAATAAAADSGFVPVRYTGVAADTVVPMHHGGAATGGSVSVQYAADATYGGGNAPVHYAAGASSGAGAGVVPVRYAAAANGAASAAVIAAHHAATAATASTAATIATASSSAGATSSSRVPPQDSNSLTAPAQDQVGLRLKPAICVVHNISQPVALFVD